MFEPIRCVCGHVLMTPDLTGTLQAFSLAYARSLAEHLPKCPELIVNIVEKLTEQRR